MRVFASFKLVVITVAGAPIAIFMMPTANTLTSTVVSRLLTYPIMLFVK